MMLAADFNTDSYGDRFDADEACRPFCFDAVSSLT